MATKKDAPTGRKKVNKKPRTGELHDQLTKEIKKDEKKGIDVGGRPPAYESPEELEKIFAKYFDSYCAGRPMTDLDGNPVFDKWGNPVIIDRHPPTIGGLAVAAGVSRATIFNYQKDPVFKDVVGRAIDRVQRFNDEMLYDRDGQRGAQYMAGEFARLSPRYAPKDEDESSKGGIVILAPVMPITPPEEEDIT